MGPDNHGLRSNALGDSELDSLGVNLLIACQTKSEPEPRT